MGKLAEAFSTLEKVHPMLRSRFGQVEAEPFFTIQSKNPPPQVHRIETSSENFLPAMYSHAAAHIDVSNSPPYRLFHLYNPAEEQFIILFHHLVGDGEVARPLMEDLSLILKNDVETLRVRSSKRRDYKDYAADEQGKSCDDISFWEKQLLPFDRFGNFSSSNPTKSSSQSVVSFTLDSKTSAALNAQAIAHKTTPFIASLLCLRNALPVLTKAQEVVIASTFSGRLLREDQDVVGPYSNTILLPLALGKMRTDEALEGLRQQLFSVIDHGIIPLLHLKERLQLPDEPYELKFVFSRASTTSLLLGDALLEPLPFDTPSIPRGIHIDMQWGETSRVAIFFNPQRYSLEQITSLAKDFENNLTHLGACCAKL